MKRRGRMRTQVAQVEAQKMGDGEPSVNSFLFYRPKDSRFVLTLYQHKMWRAVKYDPKMENRVSRRIEFEIWSLVAWLMRAVLPTEYTSRSQKGLPLWKWLWSLISGSKGEVPVTSWLRFWADSILERPAAPNHIFMFHIWKDALLWRLLLPDFQVLGTDSVERCVDDWR